LKLIYLFDKELRLSLEQKNWIEQFNIDIEYS